MVSTGALDLNSFQKKYLIPLLVFFLSACTGNHPLGVKINFSKQTLSNGLIVILVEDPTVPVVSYQTWFRVGSVDEKDGITGIAHLFEHLMFKGTKKYGPKQFFQQLEAKGAEVNAFTTRDYTVYYQNFIPELLEKVIDMESDRLANLKLTEEALRTEKQVVFEERRLRTENSPGGRMQEALWSLAYRRHPYRWPVIGYPEDLLRISLADLTQFFGAFYQPANAAIVVVGDIDATKTLEWIEKYYGNIPSKQRPVRSFPEEAKQKSERRLKLYDHVASQRFAHGYHITRASDDESYALDVLANILFEGSSSRAHRSLVEEKNLTLAISGTAFTPTYPGLFIISGTMKGELPVEEAEKALDSVYFGVQDQGVSEEEVKVAVRQLTVELIDSIRTPFGLGQFIGTVQTILGDPKRFYSDLRKYLEVTPRDVQKVAQKFLVPNNRATVVLLPKKFEPQDQAAEEPEEQQ